MQYEHKTGCAPASDVELPNDYIESIRIMRGTTIRRVVDGRKRIIDTSITTKGKDTDSITFEYEFIYEGNRYTVYIEDCQ